MLTSGSHMHEHFTAHTHTDPTQLTPCIPHTHIHTYTWNAYQNYTTHIHTTHTIYHIHEHTLTHTQAHTYTHNLLSKKTTNSSSSPWQLPWAEHSGCSLHILLNALFGRWQKLILHGRAKGQHTKVREQAASGAGTGVGLSIAQTLFPLTTLLWLPFQLFTAKPGRHITSISASFSEHCSLEPIEKQQQVTRWLYNNP